MLFYENDKTSPIRAKRFKPYKIEPQCNVENVSSDMRSLIRIFTGCVLVTKDTKFLHADNKDSDQCSSLDHPDAIHCSS